MKRLGMIAFILALVLCFAMPASAIKILPYSVPLQDMMRWDKAEQVLKLSNNEGEAISVAWPSTVDLWNYDGEYWAWDLPTGDEFSFKKAVNIGYVGAVITYTEGEPILEIRGTCAGTSGTVNAMPVYVYSILTGEGQVGRAAEFVLAPTCARMGAWGNAVKVKLDLSGTGVLGSIGLLAGLCAEVVTPAGQLWGSIAVVEHEIVATEGLVLGHFLYSANTLTFLQFALSGHVDAVAEVDDHGQFFTINGLANEDGHMLSEGYVTLKGSVNDTKQMYLVLSRIENGLGMGTSVDPLNLDAASPLFQLYTTSLAEAGTVYSAVIQQTMTVASGIYAEALRVQLRSDVKMGGSANAIFAQLDYLEAGYSHGEGAVIAAELSMPSVTSPIRGQYTFLKMEMDVPVDCELDLTEVSLFTLNVWGGALRNPTDFDDMGYLFNFEGVATTVLGFFYESDVALTRMDACLKVRINDAIYYIPLCDNQGGT